KYQDGEKHGWARSAAAGDLHGPLRAGAGGAHDGELSAVEGGFLEDLAVSPAGSDFPAARPTEGDRDHGLPGEVDQPPHGGGGEAVDAHLPERRGRTALARAAVIHRTVHHLEQLAPQLLSVTLIGGQVLFGLGGAGPTCFLGTARRQHDGADDRTGLGSAAHQSIANSRLNTTSKRTVLARLR